MGEQTQQDKIYKESQEHLSRKKIIQLFENEITLKLTYLAYV